MSTKKKHTSIQNRYTEIAQTVAGLLEPDLEDKTAIVSRVVLWNTTFPDYKFPAATTNIEICLAIFRRYLMGSTDTSRFCFELALLFIDFPDSFNSLIDLFPFPLATALHIAMTVLIDHIEPTNVEIRKNFHKYAANQLDASECSQFNMIFDNFRKDIDNYEEYVDQIRLLLSDELLDLFFSILPPQMRMHFCLVYGRPLPAINLDFSHLTVPFEFTQAIADIEGRDAALHLMKVE